MPFPRKKAGWARIGLSRKRQILGAGIALLSFVLACLGLNAILPFPEVDVVSRKLRFFQQHGNDFDTLFVGSSRIRHQISPRIFDRTMREAGVATRSFNFGVNAMLPPEDSFVVERLLAGPRRLKWVFIELNELDPKPMPEIEHTRRPLYWHDTKRTSLVFRAILNTSERESGFALLGKMAELILPGSGKAKARELFLYHGGLFARRFANIGRKTDLSHWLSSRVKDEPIPAELGSDRDGYVSLTRTMPATERADYEAGLNDAISHPESRFVSPATEQACRQLAKEVRKAGAIPIFLVTPLTTQIELGFRSESGIPGTIMSFNNAETYPQLYRSDMRFDPGHLNAVAAEEFTALIAQNFSRLLRENKIQ